MAIPYSPPGSTVARGTALQRMALSLFLALQPGLLLIDHGHFQFNGMPMGSGGGVGGVTEERVEDGGMRRCTGRVTGLQWQAVQ